MTNQQKRKRIFINKPLQRRFIGLVFFVLLAVFVFVEVDIYLTTQSLSQVISARDLSSIKMVYNHMMIKVLMFMIAVSVTAVLVALFYSHRVVGPLHRLEDEVRKTVGTGDLTHIFKVRKKDEVSSLAQTLNLMVGGLRKRIIESINLKKEMEKEIDVTLSMLSRKTDLQTEEKDRIIEQMKSMMKKMKATLEQFRIE